MIEKQISHMAQDLDNDYFYFLLINISVTQKGKSTFSLKIYLFTFNVFNNIGSFIYLLNF